MLPAPKLALLLPISSRGSTPECVLRDVSINIVQKSLAQPSNQSYRGDPPCVVFLGLDHDDALVHHTRALKNIFNDAAVAAEITVFSADELSAARMPAHEVRPGQASFSGYTMIRGGAPPRVESSTR